MDYKKEWYYLIKTLSRREYSTYELTIKLQNRNIEKNLIDELLQKLKEKNYQSNERFTNYFIRYQVSKNYGKNKILYNLKQKGIDINKFYVENNLNSIDFYSLAKNLVIKKHNNLLGKKIEIKELAKIYRFLQSKGFNSDEINYAIKNIKE